MRFLTLIRRLRHKLMLRQAFKDGLQIGKDVRIMGLPQFGSDPSLIKIGSHVTISRDVTFITHDGATWVFRARPEYKGLESFGRIVIEDNCFIGVGSMIFPNIKIGPNAVVGAGSIVTRSVPPNTVVAGSPARPLCTVDE